MEEGLQLAFGAGVLPAAVFGGDAPVVEQADVVRNGRERREQVRRDEDRGPLLPAPEDEALRDVEALHVEAVEGFVEQHDLPALHERRREGQLAPHARGPLAHGLVGRQGEGLDPGLGIRSGVVAGRQFEQVATRHAVVEEALGGHVGDLAAPQGAAEAGDAPRGGAHEAEERLEEGGLAGAVDAGQAVHGPLREVHGQAVQHGLLSVAYGEGVNRNHGGIGRGCVRPARRSRW